MYIGLTDSELDIIKKKYKVIIIDRNKIDSYVKDNNTKYNKEAYEKYTNFYKKYNENLEYNDIDYAPFKRLKKLHDIKWWRNKCDYENEFKNLLYIKLGKVKNINGFDVVILQPNTLFYKGTDYFYKNMIDTKYIWVGNYDVAISYANRYNGGCMVYKSIANLKLLILNNNNLTKIYETYIVGKTSKKIEDAFKLKFGVGINIIDRINMILKYNEWTDNTIWIYNNAEKYNFIYCNEPYKNNFYGAGQNDRIVADFLSSIKHDLDVDGWLSPETFSVFTLATSEEILLFNLNKVKLDKTNEYYWENWFEYLKIELPNNFTLNQSYRSINKNFKVLKFYNKYYKSNINLIKNNIKKIYNKDGLLIMSYNIKYLESPNGNYNNGKVFFKLTELINNIDPDICVLQEFPFEYLRKLKYLNKEFYYTQNGGRNLYIVVITKTKVNPIILSYHSNKVRNSIMLTYKNYKIICTHLEIGKRYIARSGSPLSIDEFYQVYNKNIELRLAQLTFLLQNQPDIIVGDFNFDISSEEFKFIEQLFNTNKYLDTINETSIHGIIVDYILLSKLKNMEEYNTVINYPHSDHLPILKYIM